LVPYPSMLDRGPRLRHRPSVPDPTDPRPGRPGPPGRRRHRPHPLLPPPGTARPLPGVQPRSRPPAGSWRTRLRTAEVLAAATASPMFHSAYRHRCPSCPHTPDLRPHRMKEVHGGPSELPGHGSVRRAVYRVRTRASAGRTPRGPTSPVDINVARQPRVPAPRTGFRTGRGARLRAACTARGPNS
jgi:hypothetical protein